MSLEPFSFSVLFDNDGTLTAAATRRGGILVTNEAAPEVSLVGLPGNHDDDALVAAVAEELSVWRPDLVVWEHPRGISQHKLAHVLERFRNVLIDRGYAVRCFERNAPGAKRLFLIGGDLRVDIPEPPRIPSREDLAEHTALGAILQANGY